MTEYNLLIKNAALAVKAHIDSNPLDRKSPSELATLVYVGRNKLLPAFKTLTGKTIRRYQAEKLMEAASKMLLQGISIKEVAIECGYGDYQNNFTRTFRSVYNQGPEEWTRKFILNATYFNVEYSAKLASKNVQL